MPVYGFFYSERKIHLFEVGNVVRVVWYDKLSASRHGIIIRILGSITKLDQPGDHNIIVAVLREAEPFFCKL